VDALNDIETSAAERRTIVKMRITSGACGSPGWSVTMIEAVAQNYPRPNKKLIDNILDVRGGIREGVLVIRGGDSPSSMKIKKRGTAPRVTMLNRWMLNMRAPRT
jgi:hypothetical protein